MICPMCKKEMTLNSFQTLRLDCLDCGIVFIPKELSPLMQSEIDYYYFGEHKKFYTVSEMERIVKLKAFL
jgi:hypothetical protein